MKEDNRMSIVCIIELVECLGNEARLLSAY